MRRGEDQRASGLHHPSQLRDTSPLQCGWHVLQDLAEDQAVERSVSERELCDASGYQAEAGIPPAACLHGCHVDVGSHGEARTYGEG